MLAKNILNELVVAAYKLKGGYANIQVRDQTILISVDHLRTLKRAKTYSIKEPDTLDWIDSFEPDSCYFDIGANIGQYSLYPAKKYGDKIQVYAFEPQSNNYYVLNKNIFFLIILEKIFYRIVLRYRVIVNFLNCIYQNLSLVEIDLNSEKKILRI